MDYMIVLALALMALTYLATVSPVESEAASARARLRPAQPWRLRLLRRITAPGRTWPGYSAQVQEELAILDIAPLRYVRDSALYGVLMAFIIGVDVSHWLAVVGLFSGVVIARLAVRRRYSRWLKLCVAQAPDLATLLKSRMQSGDTVIRAMRAVAPQLMDPLATQWSRAIHALDAGDTLYAVIQRLKVRIPDRDMTAILNQLVIYDRDSIPADPFGTLAAHLSRMKQLKRQYLLKQATSGITYYEGLAFIGALIAIAVPYVYLFWTHTLSGGFL